MKTLLILMGLVWVGGCSKSETASTQEQPPAVDNAATRYVNNLQMDVNKAEVNVDRMNKTIQKTQDAVNQAQLE